MIDHYQLYTIITGIIANTITDIITDTILL